MKIFRIIIPACFLIALAIYSHVASADCVSRSVCVNRHGRSTCSSEQHCSAPRAPVCSYQQRCTPVRSCVSTPGHSSCVTRDVCRRERVCL
jgi:hypothetical protein